jgi:type I restriction enzyme S subunit
MNHLFGNIPEGWELKKLHDILELNYGRALKKENRRDGPYPVYGSGGAVGTHDTSLVKGPGIIVGRKGNVGSVFWSDQDFYVIDTAYFVTSNLPLRFLYYLLPTLNFINSDAAVPGLSRSQAYSLDALLPPVPIQQRIASILSAYDELIENSQRRINILESMVRALYREWFVHFRFPGYESQPLENSSLGEIPQGWEVKTVEEIVKRIPVGKKYDQKTVTSTGVVPVFDQGKSGIIGYHNDQPGVEATDNAPVIVFANHTCYQRLIHFPFSAIQNVLPFVPNPLVERDIYWLHWATNGLVVFNDYKGHWPEFASKQLVFPPQNICMKFGDFVAPISRQTLKLDRQIANLRRTRDLLLPRLLSGQIDVTTLPESLPT